MTKVDRDRVTDILRRWDERANRYPLQTKQNQLQMLPIKEFTEDMVFLIGKALDRLSSLAPADAERLRNLDLKWQEFEMNARRDIDAGRRVPIGLGKLVHDVRYLAGLVKPASEPAATVTV